MGSYVWCLKEADRRTERQRETKRERGTEIQTDSREADRTDIERHRDSNKERERERQRTIASYREKKIKRGLFYTARYIYKNLLGIYIYIRTMVAATIDIMVSFHNGSTVKKK